MSKLAEIKKRLQRLLEQVLPQPKKLQPIPVRNNKTNN